jgi:predicted nucleotidyltransferase
MQMSLPNNISNNIPNNLTEAVLKTLRYFDVQDRPLTLVEIHSYLLGPLADEFVGQDFSESKILEALEGSLASETEKEQGFYCLLGRRQIITQRLANNYYSVCRLKRARKYLPLARFAPFVRAVALSGSEALTTSKENSDIDILLFVLPGKIWSARLFVTILYQLMGIRRHGQYVANRFCLNHYIGGLPEISNDNNVYTAIEYAALIPFVGGDLVSRFQETNSQWIRNYLPNFKVIKRQPTIRPWMQKSVEFLLSGATGRAFESIARCFQKKRIIAQEHIILEANELSFHPGSKGQQVLKKFAASLDKTP